MQTNKSEVATFCEQQALQEQAAQRGLYGTAIVGSHEAITARMTQGADLLLHQLKALQAGGKREEARALVIDNDIWENARHYIRK